MKEILLWIITLIQENQLQLICRKSVGNTYQKSGFTTKFVSSFVRFLKKQNLDIYTEAIDW